LKMSPQRFPSQQAFPVMSRLLALIVKSRP
jgi:hypothetical protein